MAVYRGTIPRHGDVSLVAPTPGEVATYGSVGRHGDVSLISVPGETRGQAGIQGQHVDLRESVEGMGDPYDPEGASVAATMHPDGSIEIEIDTDGADVSAPQDSVWWSIPLRTVAGNPFPVRQDMRSLSPILWASGLALDPVSMPEGMRLWLGVASTPMAGGRGLLCAGLQQEAGGERRVIAVGRNGAGSWANVITANDSRSDIYGVRHSLGSSAGGGSIATYAGLTVMPLVSGADPTNNDRISSTYTGQWGSGFETEFHILIGVGGDNVAGSVRFRAVANAIDITDPWGVR